MITLDVGKNGGGASQGHRIAGGGKTERWDDHLVAWSDPCSDKSHVQRRGARVDRHALAPGDHLRELVLEGSDFWALREHAGSEHAINGLALLGADVGLGSGNHVHPIVGGGALGRRFSNESIITSTPRDLCQVSASADAVSGPTTLAP